MQLQRRLSLSSKELLVLISRLRIAESSSVSVEEAPCMDVPPVMFTFVFGGAGEEVREDALLLDLKSDIRVPDAEGGARGVGAWITAGLGWRVEVDGPLLGVKLRGGVGRFVM